MSRGIKGSSLGLPEQDLILVILVILVGRLWRQIPVPGEGVERFAERVFA
jgi:hypothetical protein